MRFDIKSTVRENKHLLWIGLLNFFIIYASTFTTGYGYFIDEFYYIACANHPSFGYVDQPPIAAFVLFVYQFFFGDSVYAIRILPAFAYSFSVIFTGLIAKQLGGSKASQIMSALCIFASPVYAALAGFYSMNAYEPLLSVLAFYFVILMIKQNDPKKWIQLGIIFGLGLMNKHTAGVYIVLIPLCILLTPQRKLLFTRYFIYCIIISLLIFLPNILWNVFNDYPTIEFYENITVYKNVPVTPGQFIISQCLYYSPVLLPIWVAGVIYLFLGNQLKSYKLFAYLFILAFLFFMITKTSRFDRLAFAYPAVIPAGAIFIEKVFNKYNIKWLYGIVYLFLFSWYCLTLPVLLPYLSYESSASLTKLLGVNTELEKGKKPLIPQTLSDRIGWQNKVDMVGKVFLSLPDNEKDRTIIAASDYGMAGALELLGKKYNFKNVVSGHNNYFFWSKSRLDGDIVLQVAHKNSYDNIKRNFETVDSTDAFFANEYCSPYDQNLTVFICKNPKFPLTDLLEKAKFFY